MRHKQTYSTNYQHAARYIARHVYTSITPKQTKDTSKKDERGSSSSNRHSYCRAVAFRDSCPPSLYMCVLLFPLFPPHERLTSLILLSAALFAKPAGSSTPPDDPAPPPFCTRLSLHDKDARTDIVAASLSSRTAETHTRERETVCVLAAVFVSV